ncbi:hypothetical protein UlMin_044095 [Ulmus minor]
MPSLFYKSYWNIVGAEVVSAVGDFFVMGTLHPYINTSNIVLVSKSQNATSVNHYRPIAVCNVIYKVISKILADRLKPLLSQLICPTQSAFVPGRSIHDNTVLIQEVIHAMKHKKGAQGWMGLKIDLQKAYDRLSWRFLETVLRAFGFHPRWIHWIMTWLIKGFRLSRHTPAINHLFFADDVFLLGKCLINEAFYFKSCLDDFCGWSSQSFNSQKSNIFFNRAANMQVSNLITSMMGFSRILPNNAYLGLPLFRSGKVSDFNFLVELLDSKLAGWKARVLSKAKKLTVINSVALSLPIYVMQATKIPASICAKLDARIRSFWWGFSSNGRTAICLKAWDVLCRPKSCGGVGFRKMADFNKALLSKWGWKLISGFSSFCLDILRSCYLLRENFLDATAKPTHSPFWKAILACRDVLNLGACYLVGDGRSIDPWKDPWVPNIPSFRPQMTTSPSASIVRVKDFIIQPGLWDINKLNDHFVPEDVRKIMLG